MGAFARDDAAIEGSLEAGRWFVVIAVEFDVPMYVNAQTFFPIAGAVLVVG